ncbi:MAG TPA: sodium:solute symporter family protein [Sumerlaeia bacterium]|nr:sodium:solute symporter family protein [Sumerlaeia bacterium]
MRFSLLDWTIVLVYVAFAFGVGVAVRKRVRSVADFLVAGRRVRLHLGIASLVATELGLVTMMYMAEEGFRNGFAALIIGVIWATCYMVIGRTGFIIDRIRRLRLLTITEFFEARYSRGVRFLGALLLVTAGTLGMGVFAKAGAVFIVHFTNIPPQRLDLTMTVLVLAVLGYTVLGGMISVVLTDYVQFIVLAVSMTFATGFVLHNVGYADLFDKAGAMRAALPDAGFNPITHPQYGWWFIAFMLVFNMAGCILWQPVAQRVLAAERPELNKKIFTTVSLMFLGRAFFPMLWGIGAAVYLGSGYEDPLAAMPDFLARIVPIGFSGLLAAGMIAALMSTYDSYLLAWGGVIVQDLIAPFQRNGLSERTRVLLTRLFVIIIGALMLVFGIWHELKDSAFRFLVDLCILYYAGGMAVIIAGLYWRRATTCGAYLGFLCGGILPVAYIIGDLMIQGQGEEAVNFVRQWIPDDNLRRFLSFVLGAIGVVVGSLLPIGKPKILEYPEDE